MSHGNTGNLKKGARFHAIEQWFSSLVRGFSRIFIAGANRIFASTWLRKPVARDSDKSMWPTKNFSWPISKISKFFSRRAEQCSRTSLFSIGWASVIYSCCWILWDIYTIVIDIRAYMLLVEHENVTKKEITFTKLILWLFPLKMGRVYNLKEVMPRWKPFTYLIVFYQIFNFVLLV